MLTAENMWILLLHVKEENPRVFRALSELFTSPKLEGFGLEGERSSWALGIRTKHSGNLTFRCY